jgi:hypothetical protein
LQNSVIQIAKGLDFGPLLDRARGIAAPLVAPADQGQHDAIVCALKARVPGKQGAGGRHSGFLDESPAILFHSDTPNLTDWPLGGFDNSQLAGFHGLPRAK